MSLLLPFDHLRRLSSRLHRFRIALHTRGWRGLLTRADRATETVCTGTPEQAGPLPPRRRAGRRILVIDAAIPRPERDSGSVRAINLMRTMREMDYVVDFLPVDGRAPAGHAGMLDANGIGVVRTSALAGYPRLLRDGRYDIVVVSRYHLAEYLIPIVRRTLPDARVILDTVDLHHLREGREARLRNDSILERLARQTARRELAAIAAADATWVVSPTERDLLRHALPGAPVVVLPNIVPASDAVAGFREREGLLFIGGARHPPNLDAVRWLLQEIYPGIRARSSHCRLHVVGAGFPEALSGMAIPDGVHVHGFVADIEPLLARCRVGLAPLRFGAGVKGKVNACMAAGMPVVATDCAAEGMHLRNGVDVLIADDAATFADAAVRLHSDQPLWQRLSTEGQANVRRHFSFETARQALTTTFSGTG